METLEQVRTLDPVAPAGLRPGLPPDLDTICRRCLEKDPAHRYRSAQEVADDLACFRAGEPVSARPPTLLEGPVRFLGYSRAWPSGQPALRSWGVQLLLMASFPAVVQLVLFLLWADVPAYPAIGLVAGLVMAALGGPLVIWTMLKPLQQVALATRRYFWSLAWSRLAGYVFVPLLVVLMRPGHDQGELYLVFPLLIVLEGNRFLLLGSDAGYYYPISLVYYVAAGLVTLAPWTGPLVSGVLIGGTLLLDGLHLRRLQD